MDGEGALGPVPREQHVVRGEPDLAVNPGDRSCPAAWNSTAVMVWAGRLRRYGPCTNAGVFGAAGCAAWSERWAGTSNIPSE